MIENKSTMTCSEAGRKGGRARVANMSQEELSQANRIAGLASGIARRLKAKKKKSRKSLNKTL